MCISLRIDACPCTDTCTDTLTDNCVDMHAQDMCKDIYIYVDMCCSNRCQSSSASISKRLLRAKMQRHVYLRSVTRWLLLPWHGRSVLAKTFAHMSVPMSIPMSTHMHVYTSLQVFSKEKAQQASEKVAEFLRMVNIFYIAVMFEMTVS